MQRKLHWLVVGLVASQFLLQSAMKDAMTMLDKDLSLTFVGFLVTTVHTWGGALVGLLMAYRLWLRWRRPVPVGAGRSLGLAKVGAACLHWAFYAVLISMALTGMFSYYFSLEWASRAHEIGKWVLYLMILAHVLAALLHHFWKKDDVMRQMLGKGRHTDTMAD